MMKSWVLKLGCNFRHWECIMGNMVHCGISVKLTHSECVHEIFILKKTLIFLVNGTC